ncbi:CU044_5270 family protein [Microbacterium suaedae]|uniref:CU044_5270 family protein n=1 Tax=Microbacterium suaedae TaxID=2067813 RepID=UPI000DA174C4|nr:CU044_5270 family protein [Microbacterium suaedae]
MNDVDDLIRQAKPGTSRRDLPLTDRAEESLRRILAAENEVEREPVRRRRARRRPRWRATSLALGAAAVLIVAIFAPGISPSPQQTAVAATPPLLAASSVPETAQAELEKLASVRAQSEPIKAPDPPFTIQSHSWQLDGYYGHDVVAPTVTEEQFFADGHVQRWDYVGEPLTGPDADKLPAPGTLLEEYDSRTGMYAGRTLGDPFPTDPDLIADHLAFMLDEDGPSTVFYFGAVTTLINDRIPSAAEEAAALRFLAGLDGITVEGEVTDRLGRDGIAFSANDRGDGSDKTLLIVSPDTGKILATETIYIGDTRTDIESPAVIHYAAWERQ